MSIYWKKVIGVSASVLGTAFVAALIVAKKKKADSTYENDPEQKNPLEGKKVIFVENAEDPENADGVRGHLEAVGDSDNRVGVYEKYVKRGMDVVLSFGGLVVLSPILVGIAIAIKIDDPGPVFFTQKRLGQNKRYFKLHKFRSMKMCTPHDVPTHMLENPEQYITKVGKFLRAHSLDELPQIWDIFVGNMSVIGPRPGLWNQDVLTAERDKYGANDIKPGLTGWAQINGRDELEIPDKAKLDGEYVRSIGVKMDVKCFLGSVGVFAKDDSVVEGGTGEMKKERLAKGVADCPKGENEGEKSLFEKNWVGTSPTTKKRILIAGKGSYIGEKIKKYLQSEPNWYEVDMLDTVKWIPRVEDFRGYDVVINVAGIAHIKETSSNKEMYYRINRDLCIEMAKTAKLAHVSQFVLLSSMSVYGKVVGHITSDTEPNPISAYGDSKLQADKCVLNLMDDTFLVAVLRPPMVYGENCKGNYQILRKCAINLPIFPNIKNKRSMIFIGNLCEFIKNIIDEKREGIFFPQNDQYVCTYEMVKIIAQENGKSIVGTKIFNSLIGFLKINVFEKVFGNLTYEKVDCVNKFSFEDSIKVSEKKI